MRTRGWTHIHGAGYNNIYARHIANLPPSPPHSHTVNGVCACTLQHAVAAAMVSALVPFDWGVLFGKWFCVTFANMTKMAVECAVWCVATICGVQQKS